MNIKRKYSEVVTEQMDGIFCINHLPDEVIVLIFGYLTNEERCRAGFVCKRWYALSRVPVLWNRVDVRISKWSSEGSKNFLQLLPPSISHLRVDFYIERRDCFDFYVKLWEKCPNLQVLVFRGAKLELYVNNKYLNFFQFLPTNTRVLVLQFNNIIGDILQNFEDSYISKVEVLDLSYTTWWELNWNQSFFYQMPRLRKLLLAGCRMKLDSFRDIHSLISQLEVLDLEDTDTDSKLFHIIHMKGFNLRKLYICNCPLLEDEALKFNDPIALLRLNIICLRGCFVSYITVISLIKSCPSLQHVYVSGQAENTNPAYDYMQCNSEKVHILESGEVCHHYRDIDYMRE